MPVELPNGVVIHIEATSVDRVEDVAVSFDLRHFQPLVDAIGGIAEAVVGGLKRVGPDKGSVEFGLEVGLETGQLAALLVKGTGTANMKVIIEWSKDSRVSQPALGSNGCD